MFIDSVATFDKSGAEPKADEASSTEDVDRSKGEISYEN
ncbi:hypothetical protein SynSYN20_02940 [Synechococcus sp. SYN20]|nr:hypothetical protein SynSYN20_02940 [Synechococcus sp. SYN20]